MRALFVFLVSTLMLFAFSYQEKSMQMVQDSQSKEIFEASPLRDSRGQVNSVFDSKHFPIYGIHKKLDLSCTDCHLEENPKEYSSAMNQSCKNCHGGYDKLADYTSGLGHNNNIHQSPHYESLDCDVCHKSHIDISNTPKDKLPKNLCASCHGQETMQNLIAR
ncbi:cytochrome c3 family protein [Helicobacter pullorum]|uniref:cytochrome c3 family protein n=1 Tax=Helicobacter pullorum TaxID=35818 RepID=UPI002431B8A9|nr:cytochrome c3 family protein [Helicobacter pullorum]